jgi:hypothetical protein
VNLWIAHLGSDDELRGRRDVYWYGQNVPNTVHGGLRYQPCVWFAVGLQTIKRGMGVSSLWCACDVRSRPLCPLDDRGGLSAGVCVCRLESLQKPPLRRALVLPFYRPMGWGRKYMRRKKEE